MQSEDGNVLVCLSPAPSNRTIIRAAAGMCSGETKLIALFIETPACEWLSQADRTRLQENMRFAQEAGAQIEVVSGDDIPFQIAEYARLAGIRRIVLGQSISTGQSLFSNPDFSERIQRLLPEAEIHVIPDGSRRAHYRPLAVDPIRPGQAGVDILISLAILSVATVFGALFDRLGFTDSNIMMAYLLGVLLISISTSRRIYSLISAIASVFLFNFFFVEPRFTFQVFTSGYPVTFAVMFLTSLITGTLAVRLKSTARQAAQTAYRTKIISDTDQMLAKVRTRSEILEVCSRQIGKLLEQPFELLEQPIPEEEAEDGKLLFPLQVQDRVYAWLRVDVREKALGVSERGILLSVLGECALALENEQNAREKEEAAVRFENERLRSTLLRAISHDLRTPLTSISGNASNLLSHGSSFDEKTRNDLYQTIYEDSLWLNNMVENLLASTRLENGETSLNFSDELIGDIIEEAVEHVRSLSPEHHIVIEPCEEFLLVRADARLIMQVVINLLDNAIKYMPSGSNIQVRTERRGSKAYVSVADDGPGVPDSEKEHIFNMFYTGESAVSDSRRSLGFGLALCKTVVKAHGGEIFVSDNDPHGAVFTFCLEAEEVSLDGENTDPGRGG